MLPTVWLCSQANTVMGLPHKWCNRRLTVGGVDCDLCDCVVAAVEGGVLPAVDVDQRAGISCCAVAEDAICPERAL